MKTSAAVFAVSLLVLALTPFAAVATAGPQRDADVRFSTFNASLNRNAAGQLVADLSTPDNAQAETVAEIIQRVRPDVLLINEFDFDPGGRLRRCSRTTTCRCPTTAPTPINYPYRYVAPSNTGIPSGFDLNNNGVVGGPDDAFGFGLFPGQFGMAVYSMYPIDLERGPHVPDVPLEGHAGRAAARRPGTAGAGGLVLAGRARRLPALLEEPLGPADPDRREDRALPRQPPDAAGLRRPRGPQRHPQPRRDPVLGRLHHARPTARYIYDDEGDGGGLEPGARFVIAGDQNSDPLDGDSIPGSIQQLLDHPLVNTKVDADEPGRGRGRRPSGRRQRHATRATRRSTPPTSPTSAPGQPARRLRAAAQDAEDHRLGGVLAARRDPLFRLVGVVPVPELRPPAGLDRRLRPGRVAKNAQRPGPYRLPRPLRSLTWADAAFNSRTAGAGAQRHDSCSRSPRRAHVSYSITLRVAT